MSFSKDSNVHTQPEQLRAQIGDYRPISKNSNGEQKKPDSVDQREIDSHFVSDRLSKGGASNLYKGVVEYNLQYEDKVRKYAAKHGNSTDLIDKTFNDRTFFRTKLIELVAAKNASPEGNYQGDLALRETNPEKATISMERFLGKEGAELYKLALEEEMNSHAYMNAVFRASTTHFKGEKWTQRPVVIVSGPSGSGKSFAAKAAVEKATELFPKQEGDTSGNDVVSVDGGVIREVSQMRKLVIQAANNKGYTGISDLHSKSSILENVKDRMREAVFAPTESDEKVPLLGVVIPETFSSNLNPAKGPKLLKDIEKLPDTKPIFCRVDGEDSTLFRKVVAYMGSRRAWKTSDFPKGDMTRLLDLNNTDIPESKAYGKKGFTFGQWGSKLAEKWFKNHSRDNLRMIITNDLVLKKEDPPGSHNWIDAKPDDKGAVLITKRAFEKWKIGDDLSPGAVALKGYTEFKFGSLINTSAELDLAIAKEEIKIRKKIVTHDLRKAKIKYGDNSPQVEKLQEKQGHLKTILQNMDIIGKDKEGVELMQQQILAKINVMEQNHEFGYFSKTKKALNHAVKALGKLSYELKDAEKTSQIQQNLREELQNLRSSSSPDVSENLTVGPTISQGP
ncbi:hypothetical protein [Legionella sp. PC997]|uniref:hypothetical protein n=1 Tax=Legionella sp. PC997 TaxID=2755562 RepID=UPI0015F9AF51|nr:hypothetical protein [Legionella sp. PC997]QMT60134.1 hypothetical protein HBNCFIEN_01504 [Legionella sp. PC997]